MWKQWFFLLNFENNINKIWTAVNKIYYFKLIKNGNNFQFDVFNVEDSINSSYNFNKNIVLNNENNLFLYLNSNSSPISFIIENFKFNNNLNYINEDDNLPYNLYFINFKHNHLNTIYLRNEYENEFGPSFNGDASTSLLSVFNKSSVYDEITKEIWWIDNNNNGYFTINKYLFTKILNFELYKTHFIYIKFDIGVSYQSSADVINYDIPNNEVLSYYGNTIKSDIKVTDISSIKYFQVILKFNVFTFMDLKLDIFQNNFFRKGTIGLNFIFLNFINVFNSNNYNLKIGWGTNILNNFNEIDYPNIITLNKNYSDKIIYSHFNTNNTKYKFYFIHKEFVVGLGILNLRNNKILSPSSDRYFVYYDKTITDLERRLHLDGNLAHRKCNNLNCSICKYDLNKCLFCYQNYYLINNNCIENTDNNKFVDIFNNLRNKVAFDNHSVYNQQDKFPKNLSNTIYTFNFKFNETHNNKSIIHTYYEINYTSEFNITWEVFTRDLHQKTSFYFKNKNFLKLSFSYFRYFSGEAGIHFGFEQQFNRDDINTFYFNESMNCSGNVFYVDYRCKSICGFGTNYYLDFNNEDIRYGNCKNTAISNKYKDPFTNIFWKCPNYCINCNLNNNLITCSSCMNGYILLNDYCIKNDLINTLNSYVPYNKCNNYLTYCSNLNGIICKIKNNNSCNINDLELINCKNNYYFNEDKTSCILSGVNEPCITVDYEKCTLCSNTHYLINNYCKICSSTWSNCLTCQNQNICLTCENQYFLSNYRCISCDNGCLNCNSKYQCLLCENNFSLFKGICIQNLISNCILYSLEKICTQCSTKYYLDNNNNCISCEPDCENCKDLDKCISCKKGFYLISGICIQNLIPFCYLYSNEKKCIKCPDNYIVTDGICEKCATGCLSCSNSKNNCTKCADKYFFKNNKCISYYIVKCKTYSIENKTNCEICDNDCDIVLVKNRKICYEKCASNQFRNKNNDCVNCFYGKGEIIKNDIIINLPTFLKNDKLKGKKYILINSKIGNIDFDYKIINKNLKITLKIQSFLKELNITLKIDKNFFKNNCLENNFIEKYDLVFNKIEDNFISDNSLKLQKINPMLPKDSPIYKSLAKIGTVSKSVVVSFSSFTILLSIFILPLLKYLTEFLEFLLIIQIFTVLKINFGSLLNTVFSWVKINITFIINFDYIITLNEESIRNNKLWFVNPKILTEEIYLISRFTMTYFIGLVLIFFYIVINIIINIKYYIKKWKKGKVSELKKLKNFNKKNTLWKIKYYWKYFYLNIIYLELPNIIFVTLIYIYNFEIIDINGILNKINIVLIINFFVISNYFYSNLQAISEYRNNDMDDEKIIIYDFFMPNRIKYNTKLIYMHIFENIRTMLNILSIIYFNRMLVFQLILIMFTQSIYLFYILVLKFPTKYEKYFYKLKEIFNLILLLLLSIKGFVEIDNWGYDIFVLFIFIVWFIIIVFNFLNELIKQIVDLIKLFIKFIKRKWNK